MEKSIKVIQEVFIESIQDLLCSALESGGSSYWSNIDSFIYPSGETKDSLGIKYEHLELPFKGGTIVFTDLEDPKREKMRLTLESISYGLQIMANKFPKHFADFISEDYDMVTGDVFLQCCLFKAVIYG